MSEVKKVTINNTKKEIMAAYEEAVSKLKTAQAQTFDPSAEAKAKAQDATVAKADDTAAKNVEAIIRKLQDNVISIMDGVVEQVTTNSEEYSNLVEAIAIKQAELKELYGIEKEAAALAALVNSHRELKAKYDAEIAETKDQIATMKRETQAEINQLREEDKAEREKIQSEWEYEFKRNKMKSIDELNDELKMKRKNVMDELNQRETVLTEKAADLSKREDVLADLKAQVDEFPQILEEAKSHAATVKAAEMQKDFDAELKFLKRDYEARIERLEDKLELAEKNLGKQYGINNALNDKLNAAYSEIKDMAGKVVDGAKANEMVARFESVINKTNGK